VRRRPNPSHRTHLHWCARLLFSCPPWRWLGK
jgi:hypothetical protein